MATFLDNLTVEQTLTLNGRIESITSTVTSAATLALLSSSTMVQTFTGSTAGQIVKLPDATTLAVGQRFEVYNGATISVAVQDGSGNPLVVANPQQLVTLRLLSTSTTGGLWAWNTIDQTMAAMDELFVTYPGTGLSVNYQAGTVYFGGTAYTIAAGSTTLPASVANGFVYVDPVSHAVTSGVSLPNNAVAMAKFTTSASAVTALNDARESVAQNLVWGLTADIQAQLSQSTASSGSLEKYARADHRHAMNINLMKAGVVAAASFTGTPKTYAVVFATAFADTNYAIHIVGQDGRSWIYSAKTASGFTISAQANQALTGEVSWTAIKNGEAS